MISGMTNVIRFIFWFVTNVKTFNISLWMIRVRWMDELTRPH